MPTIRTGGTVVAVALLFLAFLFCVTIPVTGATRPGAVFRDCVGCPEMRVIPAGSFLMGSPPDDPLHLTSEKPQHRVAFARPFAIGLYDITRGEFALFAKDTGYTAGEPKCDWKNAKVRGRPLDQADDEPVVCISYTDATAYTAWLSRRTGRSYRLPSEAEWEYAARAGTTTSRPWGNEADHAFANYGADTCCAPYAGGRDRWLFTSPVGSFPPNAFGLFDMLGNVWQRTEDCAHDGYRGAPADGAAWTTGDCSRRMIRGGGWFHGPDELRSATRVADPADFRVNDIGFRVARDL